MASAQPPCPTPSKRSTKFYHETVVFEVEGTLYRVWKHALQTSSRSVFPDMFTLPQGSEGNPEGESDANPIRLGGCTTAEFESLLAAIYERTSLSGSPTNKSPNLSEVQWIGVLRLSRMWDMPETLAMAVEGLEASQLTPIKKVKLGDQHDISHWLKDGYATLIGEPSASSLDELKTLGLSTACCILFEQNQVLLAKNKEAKHPHSSCSDCRPQHISLFPQPVPIRSASSDVLAASTSKAIESKVMELFGARIKEAERRNAAWRSRV